MHSNALRRRRLQDTLARLLDSSGLIQECRRRRRSSRCAMNCWNDSRAAKASRIISTFLQDDLSKFRKAGTATRPPRQAKISKKRRVRDEVPERFARAADSRPSLLKTFGKARQRARGDLTSQGAAVSSGAVASAKAASPP